jgi:hypothetical protein
MQKILPNFRNHKIENYYYFLGEDVWVKMLFTVFELLPSKVTRELTLEEKGGGKSSKGQKLG